MRLKKPCNLHRALGMSAHTQGEGMEPAPDQPRIERAQRPAKMDEGNPAKFRQGFAPSNHNAAQRVAVTIEVLGE
jgi:hypothetical protein